MSISTTPSQIRKECSGVPKQGTILIVETQTSKVTFIVAMDLSRVLQLLRKLVVTHKSWLGAVLEEVISSTPTCPLPKNPVKELRSVVRFITYSNNIEWTFDNWASTSSCYYVLVDKDWTYTYPETRVAIKT